ncbi:hypothetical protein NDU88_001821 [Pleurodeles waltl]|uniref:Uncharacterized protein n=1 Tax=Pleurodeles waltl TaxID=8319 RepID=A0AAV7V9F3_PLEWA|nr:hypothetical protein NDU88_001821 [Pleurodeles waltl]
MLAGSFAIKSLAKDRVQCTILLRMDNVSAVRYINHLGGTRSKPLADLAKSLWEYCLLNEIPLSAEYLPGSLNQAADWHSRFLRDYSDWKLHPSIFRSICCKWGPFAIDLFASRLNSQLPLFFSWRPDPVALASNAFLQDWSQAINYAFPPFLMITRVLAQIRRQKATSVLVVPFWQSQMWFPPFLELAIDSPLLLQSFPSLLQDPRGNPHPLVINNTLQLSAWKVSGIPDLPSRFRMKLRTSSAKPGPQAPGTRHQKGI